MKKWMLVCVILILGISLEAQSRVWRGGYTKYSGDAVFTASSDSSGVMRIWRGGQTGYSGSATLTGSTDSSGILRVWRGGHTKYTGDALCAAQMDRSGVLRIWRGGHVKYTGDAIFTVGDADELTRRSIFTLVAILMTD